MASSSSSSSSVQKPLVFINFRGEELRKRFVSYLGRALKRDGINVYLDENETRGEDLNRIFFKRIEESKVALAVISSQYTESRWCLDELVKIMERVDLRKLDVIPIFYKVDTDHVKKLDGDFGDKFWKLAKTCRSDGNIDKWINALEAVTQKLGLTLGENSDEGEFLERIVGEVIRVLSNVSTNLERDIPINNHGSSDEEIASNEVVEAVPSEAIHEETFGLEMRLTQFEEKFGLKNKSTFTIGVVGMPGIGKTTFAKTLYDKWRCHFKRCVFLRDVRDLHNNNGMVDENILLRELLHSDGKLNREEVDDMSRESLKELLLRKKSLVVLDNVSQKTQVEILLGEGDWIKEGSRILITTSDRSVIDGKVNDTYEVLQLDGRDSLQCFNYYAFRDNTCSADENFIKLSKEFVDYAKGIPLALTMLGRELNGKNQTHWEEILSKLAQSPNQMMQSVLQISYDDLASHQKDVFLDIACFFRSGDEYYMRCLVETSDSKPIDGVGEIKKLANKFLINISGGRVEMHDIMYTFGKELGSQDLCRLCDHKSAVQALIKREGTNRVRGISLDMSKLETKLRLDISTFSAMHNLRYLKFYSSYCHRECVADYKLIVPKRFEFRLDEIRYLYWLKFPLSKLPNDFKPKNLTDLNLPYSEIYEVWEGAKDVPKLKWVNLSHSSKLRNLSGLQNAKNLLRLNLEGCTSLLELPKEMKHMKNLIFLNMRGCTSLRVLPRMNLIAMKTLLLTNCSNLQKFEVISDNLENLHLDGTAIRHLPSEMGKLKRLIVLNLKDCKELVEVPECLGKLKAMQELVLSGCSELKLFPVPIEDMKCLQILLLDGTEVEDLRSGLRRGMNEISSLRRLCLSKNDMISNLPIDLCQLCHLKLLDLKYCKNLTSIPLLPPNLEILDAHGCEKLKTVASSMATLKLMDQVHSKFIFTNCNSLEQAAKNSITSYAEKKSQQHAVSCYKEGNVSEALFITSFPGGEVPSWFNYRTIGSVLEIEFPPHWCDNRLSTIVLCAVVAFPSTQQEINRFSIECTCEFKNEGEMCTSFSCILDGGYIEPRKIDSEHVFIGYTTPSHITNQVEGSLQSRDNHNCVHTKASIKFEVRDGAGKIMNCGLSLLYKEVHDVAEGNCNGISSSSDVSVGNGTLSFAAGSESNLLQFMWWLCVVVILVYGFYRVFSK